MRTEGSPDLGKLVLPVMRQEAVPNELVEINGRALLVCHELINESLGSRPLVHTEEDGDTPTSLWF